MKTTKLVLLDLQLPVSKNERYLSGDDLGVLIRKTRIKTKIIVLTSISNPLRITGIINTINPEGFILKSDIDSEHLKRAIEVRKTKSKMLLLTKGNSNLIEEAKKLGIV